MAPSAMRTALGFIILSIIMVVLNVIDHPLADYFVVVL